MGVFWFRGCDELKCNHHRVNASQSRLVCCRVRALLCFCRRCSHTLWRRKGTPDSSQGPADLQSAILACAVSVMVGVSRLPNHRKFVFASQEKAHLTSDAATDWLRRWARNPLGSARKGFISPWCGLAAVLTVAARNGYRNIRGLGSCLTCKFSNCAS